MNTINTEKIMQAFDEFIQLLKEEREQVKEQSPKKHIAFALLEIEDWGKWLKCIERPEGIKYLNYGENRTWRLHDGVYNMEALSPETIVGLEKATHKFNVEHGTDDVETENPDSNLRKFNHWTGRVTPLVRIIE